MNDTLVKSQIKIGPHDCKMCRYIAVMPQTEAKAVEDALGAGVQHVVLAEILTSYGYNISEASVRRHRKHWHR